MAEFAQGPLGRPTSFDLERHRAEVHGFGRLQANLRQIIYGGNDGIVTTFAVVAGFAGAQSDGVLEIGALAVLLFGFANLFADATSMALGAFLSARSERSVYHALRKQELAEIAAKPEQESEEVLAILQGRGVGATDASEMAAILRRNAELMADFMMSYEFGLSRPQEENPARSALYTFLSFLCFGCIPIVPYIFMSPDRTTFSVSVLAAFAALLGLGLLRWLATLERLLACLAETVLVGGACACVAYSVGLIFSLR